MRRLEARGALSEAGRSVRQEIRRRYPEPEEAVNAVREAMKDPSAVEEWASIVGARTQYLKVGEEAVPVETFGQPFRFDELPPAMRDGALECLAAAMVAWTCEQERRYAS